MPEPNDSQDPAVPCPPADTTPAPKPWYRSGKIIVFLISLTVITAALVVLIALGHLEVTETSVVAYIAGVVSLGSSLIFGRAWAAQRFRPMAIPVLLGLALASSACGSGVQLGDVLGRLTNHTACALGCYACISRIHGGQGEGLEAPAGDQASCAAECARCGIAMAEDMAGLAEASEEVQRAPVEAAALPDAVVEAEVIAAVAATCDGGEPPIPLHLSPVAPSHPPSPEPAPEESPAEESPEEGEE